MSRKVFGSVSEGVKKKGDLSKNFSAVPEVPITPKRVAPLENSGKKTINCPEVVISEIDSRIRSVV